MGLDNRSSDSLTILDRLAQAAAAAPDRPAVLAPGVRSVSYAELQERCERLAGFLSARGVQPGDRVGLLVRKGPEAVIAFLAVARAGGVVFPMDPGHSPPVRRDLLGLMQPAALFVDEAYQDQLDALEPAAPLLVCIGGGKAAAGTASWQEAIAFGTAAPARKPRPDEPVYLNLTSGTTGVPKAAVTTHANLYWNTRASIETLGLLPDDVHLSMFPIFVHPHELFYRGIFLGGTSVLIDGFSPRAIAAAVAEARVTCFMAVASVYGSLCRFAAGHAADFSSLRLAESGGMPVTPRLARDFKARFGIPIVPVWGSTETTGIALALVGCEKPGAVGKAAAHYDVRVAGEDGAALPPGEIGEMIVRGPGVCRGYFRNPEQTEAHMKNGWFHTADIVRQDEEGFIFFAGRRSGMLKVAGLKVFPSEIEAVLSEHPAVEEAAVVRAADDKRGEVPRAVIVLRRGSACGEKDIRGFCAERLAAFKVPRIVEFVDALPKSGSGKVLHRQLEEQGAAAAAANEER